jgi:hypothetical protein
MTPLKNSIPAKVLPVLFFSLFAALPFATAASLGSGRSLISLHGAATSGGVSFLPASRGHN